MVYVKITQLYLHKGLKVLQNSIRMRISMSLNYINRSALRFDVVAGYNDIGDRF